MARHAQLPADSRALYCPNYGGQKVSQFAELAPKLSGHKEFTVLCTGVPKRTMRVSLWDRYEHVITGIAWHAHFPTDSRALCCPKYGGQMVS